MRNPQSFNLAQFMAYQYVLQNKEVFVQVPALINKTSHYMNTATYGSVNYQLSTFSSPSPQPKQ
jgi:hypothetical protein